MKEIVKDLVRYLKNLGVNSFVLPKSIMEFSKIFALVTKNGLGFIADGAVSVKLMKEGEEQYLEKFHEITARCDYEHYIAIYIYNPKNKGTYYYEEFSIERFLSLITTGKMAKYLTEAIKIIF